ncbi:MAG: esterase [Verrucomicrobia bacterium]|nr:esterase [Verrucomicrobiota bacterium]
MRIITIGFICILVLSDLCAQNAGTPGTVSEPTNAPPAEPSVISPVIHRDRTVTLNVFAPKASEVILGGQWPPAKMVKGASNIWSATIGPLEPDIYTYRFWVDGLGIPDPRNEWVDVVHPGRMPWVRSVVEIPGDPPRLWEDQPVTHGTVHEQKYFSKSLGVWRHLQVYTPPDYEKSPDRFPVLYLLHGGLGPNWISLGQAHFIADNLLAQGKAKPMIIVMPDLFWYLGLPEQDRRKMISRLGDGFIEDFLKDIIPMVESSYRVSANRESRAIVGNSMGARYSFRLGLMHRELFAWVGGMSGGFMQSKEVDLFLPDSNSNLRLLWFSCGTEEPYIKTARQCSAALKAKNIPHQLVEAPGGHAFENDRRRLGEFLPLLFTEAQAEK